MDGKLLARLGVIVFVAAAVTATAIEMTRKEEEAVPASRPSEETPTDPLRQAQRRCQLLGEAAARDPECLRTWAETRERFLGGAPAPVTPQRDEGL